MLKGNVIVQDFVVRDRIRSGLVIHDQRVTLDVRACAFRFASEMHDSAIRYFPTVFRDGFGNDRRGRVRCKVDHFGTGILMLPFTCKCDGKRHTTSAFPFKDDRRVFHRQF